MAENVRTVRELNTYLKSLLDKAPGLMHISVRGELSNYKIYPSGHHYFSLKDADSAIKCVMFARDAAKLRFRPEIGMKAVCTGRVSVYERDGVCQLTVNTIEPDGLGELFVAFEQLKTRLQAEGVFDPAHKRPIPKCPRRIALITSGAGAAVQDMIRILRQRWPLTEVAVMPVLVQGTEAPAQIAGAIRYANKWQVADLLITGRGGGSMEDLWAFNDERVARAIYESEIPVISAVGHEPDVVISDFVADLRASTPSNAAELAVPDQKKVKEQLHALQIRLDRAMENKLTRCREQWNALSARGVMEGPIGVIRLRQQMLDAVYDRLNSAQREQLSRRRHHFIQLAASLEAMSPIKVLARGYSVLTDEQGTVVTSASDTEIGERLAVRLAHGGLLCRVEDIRSEVES